MPTHSPATSADAGSATPAAAGALVLVAVIRDAGEPAGDHRRLAELAGELLQPAATRGSPTSFVVSHRCAQCGADDHGSPVLQAPDGTPVAGIGLSLSRAAGWVALTATAAGAVGIDIESLDATAAAGFDDVAFDDAERATLVTVAADRGEHAAARLRAAAWTAKEAVLKAAGTGLRTDPRSVALDLAHTEAGIALRPPRTPASPTPALTLHPLPRLPAGLVGYVAVASGLPPSIRLAVESGAPTRIRRTVAETADATQPEPASHAPEWLRNDGETSPLPGTTEPGSG